MKNDNAEAGKNVCSECGANLFNDRWLTCRSRPVLCDDGNAVSVSGPSWQSDQCKINALKQENARLKAERNEFAQDVLDLVAALRYIHGIAERGEGKELKIDTRDAILNYVKKLEVGNKSMRGKLGKHLPRCFRKAHVIRGQK